MKARADQSRPSGRLPSLVRRASRRHLLRHPWLLVLSVLGVALAVAVVVGIDVANASAARAFVLGVEGVAGRSTHRIEGGPAGLPDELYVRMRRELGLRQSSPVVEAQVRSPLLPGRSLRLLGVDPFADPPVRSFSAGIDQGGDLGAFLLRSGSAALGAELAADLQLRVGDTWTAYVLGQERQLTLTALLQAEDELAEVALRDLVLVDIASAQELLDRPGRLSRIDLVLDEGPDGQEEMQRLQAWLPAGAELSSVEARAGALGQMTRAFRLNLQALSLLALLVGAFLIYNSLSFSVLQRRQLLGSLRTLGVRRGQVIRLVLGEALLIGLLGTLLGIVLGALLARGLLQMVVRTINDLYFTVAVTEVTLTPWLLAKALLLGLGATLLAAARPAREAAATAPRSALRRSALESRGRRRLGAQLLLGLGLAMLASALLWWPGNGIVIAFLAVLLAVLGYALWVGPALWFLSRSLAAGPGRYLGLLTRMAARSLAANLSRTGVAASALVIAVATTIGVAVMVGSFRQTLVDWLEVTLQADLYLSPADLNGRGRGANLAAPLMAELAALPEVDATSTYRRVQVGSRQGPVALHALRVDRDRFQTFRLAQGNAASTWPSFSQSGAIMISEPLAYHRDLSVGQSLELLTEKGWQGFEIAGVFYDYGSDRGMVMMHRSTYDRHWQDPTVQSMGLFAAPGADLNELRARVEELAAEWQPLSITSNRQLRTSALTIFDRTFLITRVLRLLAMLVAFVGILSALMALQLERARELAVLRANGLTPPQLWRLVSAETSLLGLICGFLSLPLGLLMASLLVHVINRRSFGWTLALEVPPGALVQGVLLALTAALLAGIYPAYRMSRANPALALREE